MTEDQWRDAAEEEGRQPLFVHFDAVTLGLMRGMGVDPAAWVDGLERQEATPLGVPTLIGLAPTRGRREAAKQAAAGDVRGFDVLDVVDDDGAWRAMPDEHIAVADGIHWLPVCRTGAWQGRSAIRDLGILSIAKVTLPDTAVLALVGRPLCALIDRPGFEHGTIVRVEDDGGTWEIAVQAPDVRVAMRQIPD